MWLISSGGTIRFDTKTGDYRVIPFPLQEWGLQSVPVTDLIISNNEESCWIGSKSPYLYHLDLSSEKYQRIPVVIDNDTNDKKTSENFVLSMDTDNSGRIWLATFGSGLLFLDEENRTFHNDYAVSTLATNTYAVRHGADQNLWISTDYGIARFNPKKDSLNEFGLDEGTFCEEFNERAVYEGSDGTILMGGTNGFITFNPKNFHLNTYIPPVYISTYSIGNPNVTISGQSVRDVLAVRDDKIEIPYGPQVVSFEVSVLNFSFPEKNKISWKLNGFDKEWSQAPASHIITYSNLPPGKYNLQVKGANNHGVWNHEGDSVQLIVKAPFYKQSWFPWAFGTFIAFLIFLVFWLRTRLLSRQKALLSKLVRERTKNLRNAYQKLEESQKQVVSQNKELELHHNELEELVAKRTADLEKAKKKAEESDRLKTAFLANLSHEIRTPMNAIVGFSTLLNNMKLSDDEKSEFIRMIQKSSDNLLALINDIIDISRIETGQMVLQPNHFELGPFLKNIIKSLAFEPNKTNKVDLQLDVPDKIWNYTVSSDEQRLRQVIVNLLNNALKFTSEGYIKLTVEKFKGQDMLNFVPWFETKDVPEKVLLFIVEDTGIGISETNRKNIFEPFRKAESSGKTLYSGMGLGLSIVKSILPAIGGDITFNSQPGYGSTFYFYIPAI